MPRRTVKKQMTMCGLYGNRATVIAHSGSALTYRWPCGYESSDTMMQGVGHLKRPAAADTVAFFAKYWRDGVTYECPRCRRKALAAKRKRGSA